MARNGSGTYSLPAGNPVVTGTPISSTTHNTTMTDLANAITQSLSYDGQTVPIANIPMGGFKLTGLGAATTNGDAVRYEQLINPAGVVSLNGGQVSGLRNRIRNGNFQINQRVVSGSVTLAAGAYGHDGWKGGAAGCTYTFATSGKDTTITISAGSLMQVIEDKDVEGGVFTLSQSGTAQARIAVNGAATSGAYAATPLASATATGNQTMTVEFTTGTVGKVQFNPGTVAETFERRPFQQELALCQRYYCKTFPYSTAPAQAALTAGALFTTSYTAAGGSVLWRFPVEMRATPTITTYNPASANANWRDITNSLDRAIAASYTTSSSGTEIILSVSAAATAFNAIHVSASAEL